MGYIKLIALIVILSAFLFSFQASASLNIISQGDEVYIGEEGLDVSAAVGSFTQIAWFAAASNPATDTPSTVISIGNPESFYVAPVDFVSKTGNWYRWDGGATRNEIAFIVVDPAIDIRVWDQNTNKDVTGKAVPFGNYENFRLESNIFPVITRAGYSGEGFVNIRVKNFEGTDYSTLWQSMTVNLPLTDQVVDTSLWYWVPPGDTTRGWNTAMIDIYGAPIYKAGAYTACAEIDLNNMMDNYKAPDGSDYTGKTRTATKTVTIASDTVKVEASKDAVVRGNPFRITVTGRPNTCYIVWIKETGNMAGTAGDQPPLMLPNQNNVENDPVGGPWNIGTYEYEGGAGSLISSDVPVFPDNGVYYYAAVKTSSVGTRTISFITGSDTKDKTYTVRVEKGPGAFNMPPPWNVDLYGDRFTADEVDVKVENGTVTIVAAGDQSYFLGQDVKLSGTNSETDTVYMFITGPELPGNGGRLTDPRTAVINNDPVSFTSANVLEDNTWEYKWQTSNLNIDAGTYTIYAIATPNDKNNLTDARYATISLIIRKPFVSATLSQSTILAGDTFYVRGMAEGQPSPGVAIWIMGNDYALYSTESVYSDGTFEKEITEGLTSNMTSGQYFVVVQHPMYNDQLDVYPIGDDGYTYRYVVGPYPVQGAENIIFTFQGPGSLQGSDAVEALIQALDNPSVDDTYTKLGFLVEEPPSSEFIVLELYPGWNFISVPKKPTDNFDSAGYIFRDVDTGHRCILYYDACQRTWEIIEPTDIIEPLKGYWIYSQEHLSINVTLSQDSIAARYLCMGWNGIGFSGTTPTSARFALLSVDVPPMKVWSQLIGYNSVTQSYDSTIFNADPSYNSLMQPCKGYWIYMNGQNPPWELASISA
jgi:hypothetical protein